MNTLAFSGSRSVCIFQHYVSSSAFSSCSVFKSNWAREGGRVAAFNGCGRVRSVHYGVKQTGAKVDDVSITGEKDLLKYKRTPELLRALVVFKLCSFNVFVRNSAKVSTSTLAL